jgi:hypothetical protein
MSYSYMNCIHQGGVQTKVPRIFTTLVHVRHEDNGRRSEKRLVVAQEVQRRGIAGGEWTNH